MTPTERDARVQSALDIATEGQFEGLASLQIAYDSLVEELAARGLAIVPLDTSAELTCAGNVLENPRNANMSAGETYWRDLAQQHAAEIRNLRVELANTRRVMLLGYDAEVSTWELALKWLNERNALRELLQKIKPLTGFIPWANLGDEIDQALAAESPHAVP